MTNGEKYKTPEERDVAFRRFCDDERLCNPDCPCNTIDANCRFIWLDLEADDELLHYPCCGGVSAPEHGSNGFYYVQCGNCGLITSNSDTKAEAIAAWNRRVK